MKYNNTQTAVFLSRPNRFVAEVLIDDKTEIVHVKNTGRCKELRIKGATVILEKSDNPKRTTNYDLIPVYKGDRFINMDSYAPNKAFFEYLKSGKYIENITLINPEKTFGNSRFDFYVETENRKIFIEVKGVTLENNGVVMFPDAPTERGIKHLNELIKAKNDGYETHAVFVIQMENVEYFTPNYTTHLLFGETLKIAEKSGVVVKAFDCIVTENSLEINKEVKVILGMKNE
jgi:sugar fermentation stimulation protein A